MPYVAQRQRGWLIDIIFGGLAGAVVGAIIAVNVVIYAGPEEGYEASIPDVFDHNPITGLATVAILGGAPLLGIALARRLRQKRT